MYFLLKKNFFSLCLFLVAAIAVLSSCNDPDDIIGIDIQPPGDKIGLIYTDTTTVTAYTVREDSLRTDEVSLQLLGSYTDSVFGRTDAGIFVQALLPSSNVDLGDTLALDSVVLTLAYNGFYGDTFPAQTYHVYRLTGDMQASASYYSDQMFAYDPAELGSTTVNPSPHDSVMVNGVNTAPHIRIRLNDSFGDTLLQMSQNNQLTSNDNFLSIMKGLYIKTDSITNRGGISYINLLALQSNLTLYYRSDTTHHVFNFIFSVSSARTTHFVHDYTGTPVQQQLNDSTFADSLTYVQSMSGVKTKIRLPNLKNYITNGMIAVNKAELEITVADNSDNRLTVPDKLLVLGINESGIPVFLPDEFESSGYYGGTYDATNRKYKFNIARYVQEVLTGDLQDYGLYLAISGGVVQASRVIIGGRTNPTYRIKLNLYYTKP